MKILADICVTPLTGKTSVREEIALAVGILRETGLPVRLHAYGTNIEGDFDVVMAALKRVHEALHENGVPRISTTMRLGSRIDKDQTLDDKVGVVERLLDESG